MQRALLVSAFCAVAACSALAAVGGVHFDPGVFGCSDGALLLEPGGNYVEPYFATKALLSAQDAGADVTRAALLWISWVLPRQQRDGRIGRFCRKPDTPWHACGNADADDSMLALWLQLLYREAPATGLPSTWQDSVTRARRHLDSLRNARLGIYHVSRSNHVGLFMDNVEVYVALKDIAAAERRFGQSEQAARTQADAQKLATALQHIFWDRRRQSFRVSTQKREASAFYPDAVAQTFALLADVPTPDGSNSQWPTWIERFGPSWLYRRHDPHPWGLVALAALHAGDNQSALCWVSLSQPLRYSPSWNILEEAVFQGLQYRFRNEPRSAAACAQVLAK